MIASTRQTCRTFGAVLAICAVGGLSSRASAEEPHKLGFVVRDWFTSVYNTKFADECPEGMAVSNDEYYWRGLNKDARAKFTDNGLIQVLTRSGIAMHRGPNHEDVCLNPTVIKDPTMRVVEGTYSYGENLDGTEDGHATAKSCKHDKFVSPLDGKTKVDNQMYRLVGCNYGWRYMGLVDTNANEMRRTSGLGMILVEISGITDPRNSDDVNVAFYRSVDQYALDGTGTPLPYTSYRVETDTRGKPTYGDTLKGRIKDGVLITERGDVTVPYYGNYNFLHPVINDFGLRLEIAPDGKTAKGQITGYYNLEEFLYYVGGMVGHPTASDSCPAMYEMGHKLADGYPDPKTGECSMLSSAFDITAFAAYVIHPKTKEMRTSQR